MSKRYCYSSITDKSIIDAEEKLDEALSTGNYRHSTRGKFSLVSLLKKLVDPTIKSLIESDKLGSTLDRDFLPSEMFRRQPRGMKQQKHLTPEICLDLWRQHIQNQFIFTRDRHSYENLYVLESIVLKIALLKPITRNLAGSRSIAQAPKQQFCSLCYRYTEYFFNHEQGLNKTGSSKYCTDHVPGEGSKNPQYQYARRKKYDELIPKLALRTSDNIIDSIPTIGWFKSQIKLPHTSDKRAMIYRLLNSNISRPIYSRLISSYEKHDDIRDIANELKASKNKVRKLMSDFECEVNDILLNPYLDHSTNRIYQDYEVAKSEILTSHREFLPSLLDSGASVIADKKYRRPFYEALSFKQIIESWQAYQAENRYH